MIHYKEIVGRINMKSSKHGKNISISVENITPFGIWLFVKSKEYFLSYKDFPFFREQVLAALWGPCGK